MAVIKRTVTVTVLTKGDERIEKVGDFNIKQKLREGYSISAPRLYRVEVDMDDFYAAAKSKVLVDSAGKEVEEND